MIHITIRSCSVILFAIGLQCTLICRSFGSEQTVGVGILQVLKDRKTPSFAHLEATTVKEIAVIAPVWKSGISLPLGATGIIVAPPTTDKIGLSGLDTSDSASPSTIHFVALSADEKIDKVVVCGPPVDEPANPPPSGAVRIEVGFSSAFFDLKRPLRFISFERSGDIASPILLSASGGDFNLVIKVGASTADAMSLRSMPSQLVTILTPTLLPLGISEADAKAIITASIDGLNKLTDQERYIEFVAFSDEKLAASKNVAEATKLAIFGLGRAFLARPSGPAVHYAVGPSTSVFVYPVSRPRTSVIFTASFDLSQ